MYNWSTRDDAAPLRQTTVADNRIEERLMELLPGQNTSLGAGNVTIDVTVDGMPGGMDLDVSAFMLTETGKVASDDGFVFYGQPRSKDGALDVDAGARRFEARLDRVPATIQRIAFAATIDKGLGRGQSFRQLASARIAIRSGDDAHSFSPDVKAMSETALILVELYRRDAQWKLRAVGQGFNGGLGPLAKHFGVDISDDPDAGAPAAPAPGASVSQPPPPAPPPPAPAAAPVAAPKPINLTKITLEKAKPISLEKASGGFGKIIVNLRWTKGGGILSKSIDLDLGAMIELQDGSKTVVQALGRGFGEFDQAPYVKLMGDDRTGSSGDGEFLHINGDRWDSIRRVLIFAFIYEGVPNWAKANGGVTIRMPAQPELEARMDSPNDRDGMCAIALLENAAGKIKATKHVEYFAGHAEMDRRFGYGFKWKAGSK